MWREGGGWGKEGGGGEVKKDTWNHDIVPAHVGAGNRTCNLDVQNVDYSVQGCGAGRHTDHALSEIVWRVESATIESVIHGGRIV